jgi:2-dehydro-3-deoxygluconokinase
MKRVQSDQGVVLFGELMMRLSTKRHERIVQAREFDVSYSGAEANLGVALGGYGIESLVVSAVPPDATGDACLAYLRQFPVDLRHVTRCGSRLGIYFVETGAAQRPSTFLYNRKGSSITDLRPGDLDWNAILVGKSWFHVTGITPALGDNVAAITKEACATAAALGLTVSVDLNFRRKLWSAEKAREVMGDLMQYTSVLFTNEEEAATVFGVTAEGAEVAAGRVAARGYESVARRLHEMFGLRYVSITLRESISATANGWSGMLFDGERFHMSRRYQIDYIVDRVGGGDAYSAGIIYGLLTEQDLQETVEFAAAASCLKHSIHGDFNLASFEETVALMDGDGSGRIQR